MSMDYTPTIPTLTCTNLNIQYKFTSNHNLPIFRSFVVEYVQSILDPPIDLKNTKQLLMTIEQFVSV